MTSCVKQYKFLTTKDNEYLKYIHIINRNKASKVAKLVNNIKATNSKLKEIKYNIENINDEYTTDEKKQIPLSPLLMPIPVEQKPEQIEDNQNSFISTPMLLLPPPMSIPVEQKPEQIEDNKKSFISTPILLIQPPMSIPVGQKPILPPVKIINNYRAGNYTGGVQILKNHRYRINLRR